MKCWPVIRHIRWFYLAWRFDRYWQNLGRHIGAVPNPSDLAFLDKVWKGLA